jgi:hypothetical protein
MADDEIGALIRELKELKVREARIKVDEARIIASLEAANARNARSDIDKVDEGGFAVGDRVRIINKVRKPANWSAELPWDDQQARQATVTRVTTGKVHFVTDNGVETWRAHTNLRRPT